MCPGGVAPCATSPGEVVTNGWSLQRDQATANSGIVVELKLEDFKPLLNLVLSLEWNSKVSNKKAHLAGKLKKYRHKND
jgi:uncharacterized FAD-dependent dehydrogenase